MDYDKKEISDDRLNHSTTSGIAKDLLKKFDDTWVSPPRLGELSVEVGGVSYDAAEYFDFYSKPCEFKPLDFVNKEEAEAIPSRKNTFTLTDEQLDKLQDVLSDHTDCGPMHEGWCSNELIELIEVFSNE